VEGRGGDWGELIYRWKKIIGAREEGGIGTNRKRSRKATAAWRKEKRGGPLGREMTGRRLGNDIWGLRTVTGFVKAKG